MTPIRSLRTCLAALVFLAAAGCTSQRATPPNSPPPPPPPPSTTRVNMVGTQFSPRNVTVAKGDTVHWVNTSNVWHTVTSGPCFPCASNGLFESGRKDPGQEFRVVFGPGTDVPGQIVHVDSSGVFPYYCIPHAHVPMDGTITVTP